jgi:putative heme iron utilization protein
MEIKDKNEFARLIRSQRWAALATLKKGTPFASMVAYVPEPDFSGFLLHLSRLSTHTQNLMADPRASLVISQSDTGESDPQTLARISFQGTVNELPRDEPEYVRARGLYLQRLPSSEMLFGFVDFILFRLIPEEARYVGGFGRAVSLTTSQLRTAATQ